MDMHEIVMHIKNNEYPAVLATLVGVEGHSYRKAGAVMLFFEGGAIGSLSPGCLESDLQLRTSEIWASDQAEVVEYDMLSPDDFSWGEAIGCGGKIKVVLEPIKGELRRLLLAANDRLAANESLILNRTIAGGNGGYVYSLLPRTCVVTPMDSIAFSTVLNPKPRLVIFGGGQDAEPIASLAARVGFRVVIADWRENSLESNLSGAEKVLCSPVEAASRLGVGRSDYVLIGSHQFQRDRQFLEHVIPLNPCYIGIIGSSVRIHLLLEGLEAPPSLHAPVGLSIGGEGPEEIAVSIVAQMIQIRRAGSRKLPKGGDYFENSGYLSGSRTKQSNGNLQGFHEAVPEDFTRERRAQ